eukprot:GHVN01010433.1.p1 GENE.GHVN01010433.1~~GHVN01010433.1.p1  ORF type:complete len:359 (+),score=75.86 GHVN01010433.1:30-1106(+)
MKNGKTKSSNRREVSTPTVAETGDVPAAGKRRRMAESNPLSEDAVEGVSGFNHAEAPAASDGYRADFIPHTEESDKAMIGELGGVVYISGFPNGFFEDKIFAFFKQFGRIGKIKLLRNPKTCTPRGSAYIQFRVKEVAEIVVNTMHNYMMGGNTLKARLLSDEEAADPRIYRGPRDYRGWWSRQKDVAKKLKDSQDPDAVSMSLVLGICNVENRYAERLRGAGITDYKPIRLLGDVDEAKMTELLAIANEKKDGQERDKKARTRLMMRRASPSLKRRVEEQRVLKELKAEKGKLTGTPELEPDEQTEELRDSAETRFSVVDPLVGTVPVVTKKKVREVKPKDSKKGKVKDKKIKKTKA